MKHVFILLCVLSITLASCNSKPDEPTTDGSTLIVPADPVILSKTDSVKTIDLKLSCGCGFTLQVTSISGDTNVIKFTVDKMDDILSQHTINFSYSPSSASSGSAPVTLNFLAKKHSYTYTNKVSVRIN